MATFFISDLHLNPQEPKVFTAFVHFISRVQAGDSLYILGDFFDAWLGDDEDHPFALELKNALAQLTERGVLGFMLTGNRDFLLGTAFCQATGFTLLPEEHIVTLNGERVLLMHGDSLCTGDAAYMEFRQMVRQSAWQAQVLSLPLPQRRTLAAQLRAQSQSLNAMKADDIMDVTQHEVEARMQHWDVTKLIHGHTHRPATHRFSLSDAPCERWVLGDWGDYLWCLVVAEQWQLVQEPIG
ncbi:MAG: hypothetical protein RL497_2862 [Pseudomonadota bacterium]|jgi:UDP-2,3-diacylglucosamine hydrolase